ncbi:MAG: aldehyde ferredoxin oxidoreductase family protein [Candidatus Bathyarchaeia archaeon]
MVYGWAGTILRIDLTKNKISKTPSSEYTRLFLGGRGVNAKLMFDESKPGVSAFDPENPIIIGAGALAGTGLLGMVKHVITTRSPEQVPEGFAFQCSGGSLAAEMKYAGYDHIVIKGRAEKPTCIHIENDDIAFNDASSLWGKGVFDTNTILREELSDPEIKILAIGQAGENLVRFATIEHEYRSGTGLGAVWGAKNLKAIAVRGTKGIKVYDPEAVLKINEELLETHKENEKELIRLARERGEPEPSRCDRGYGTIGATAVEHFFDNTEMGVVGYLEGHEWPDLDKTRGKDWLKTRSYRDTGCCPFACAGLASVPGVGIGVMRCYPFWNLWQLKMTDLDKMFEATMLMSDYGMDNRNLCMTVSYLMKLYEKGIITAKDTDGVPMEWGSGDALIETVHKVANRKGFGDVLADGPFQLAKKLGPKAEALFMHSRGQVAHGDERRTQVGYALSDAVDTRRGTESPLDTYQIWERYMKKIGVEKEIKEAYARAKKTFGTEKAIIPWEWEGKPIMVISAQHVWVVKDILGVCIEGLRNCLDQRSRMEQIGTLPRVEPAILNSFKAATGLNVDENYLMSAAERTWNVERAYNVREGFTRDDHTIAEGWHKWPITSGSHKGRVVDKAELERAKSKLYKLRGWDVKTGWPTKETYERLDLKDVAKSLEKLGRIPKKKEVS